MTTVGSEKVRFPTTGIAGYTENGTPLHHNDTFGCASNLTVNRSVYTDNVAFDGFIAKNIQVLAVSGTDHLDTMVGMAYSTKSNTGI